MALTEALARLPAAERILFVLSGIEGMGAEHAASWHGRPETEVKTRLHRARQAVREILDSRFGQEPR